MELSKGNKEKYYEQLVKATLHLWNSLGISRDMVIKILSEELNNDKALSIFITDIKTDYTVLETYRDNEKKVWNEVDGYKVGFVLNEEIACEIRISANECNGCREHIKAYITNKIGGIK